MLGIADEITDEALWLASQNECFALSFRRVWSTRSRTWVIPWWSTARA
jgi:hypothetical protein